MASRRPHKKMKIPGCRVYGYGIAVLPSPPPLVWMSTGAFAGMTRWVAGVYPGSESGTCFRTNDEVVGRRPAEYWRRSEESQTYKGARDRRD